MNTIKDALDKLSEAVELLAIAFKLSLEKEKSNAAEEPFKIKDLAVKVNNYQELSILMKHYESLGWYGRNSSSPDTILKFNKVNPFFVWTYHDKFFAITDVDLQQQYQVIDFDFFSVQKGITPLKLVLTTQDGIEIWDKQEWVFLVHCTSGAWRYHGTLRASTTLLNDLKYKAFSTKEAAEKWLEKKNNPEVCPVVQMDSPGNTVTIREDGLSFNSGLQLRYHLSMEELEKVLKAVTHYKKIND